MRNVETFLNEQKAKKDAPKVARYRKYEGVDFGEVDTSGEHEKVVIVAGGPSISGFDFDLLLSVQDTITIITVNKSIEFVPYAHMWVTIDPWGLDGKMMPPPDFSGTAYVGVPDTFNTGKCQISQLWLYGPPVDYVYLHRLDFTNRRVVEPKLDYRLLTDISCLPSANSGFAAFNVATYLRPKKILLMGIDGSSGYFYGNYKSGNMDFLPHIFDYNTQHVKDLGIDVACSGIDSKLTCFKKMDPYAGLEWLLGEN